MQAAGRKQEAKAVESRYGAADRTHIDPPDAVTKEIVRMPAASRGDLFARVMGFIVFLLGVAIILGVLKLGFDMYQDPRLGSITARGASPNAVEIGTSFVRLVIRIVLLFLFSVSGSLIANKGISMYFTALRRPE